MLFPHFTAGRGRGQTARCRKSAPCPALWRSSSAPQYDLDSLTHLLAHSFCESASNSILGEILLKFFFCIWTDRPCFALDGARGGGGCPSSVLELAGVHLGPVQGRPPVHRCVRSLRRPQGLGGGLLRDLGVMRGSPIRIARVPDQGGKESQG